MNKQILTQLNDGLMNDTFNYVVMFSNNNVKTGITKNPFSRLQNYVQESLRSDIFLSGYYITPPSEKTTALQIEKSLCAQFEQYKISSLKEWFSGNDHKYPSFFGHQFSFALIETFFHIHGASQSNFYRNPYKGMIDRASVLGRSMERFNAAKETRLAIKDIANRKRCFAFLDKKFQEENEILNPEMWARRQEKINDVSKVSA